jgi:protein-disulfide isomerase
LAAEAAGRLGGNEGYWRMHAWLMANQDRFDDEALRQAATKLGFDADSFFIAMTDDDLQANIQDDIQAGSRLPRLRLGTAAGVNSIPTIFVNGRYIPRWRLDDRSVLEEIIAEAADQ